MPTSPPVAPPVSRTAIHQLLDRSIARPLTTVTAARGYGKTTMLAAWARSRGTAWLTLTIDDRDPGTFAQRLVEVLSGDASAPHLAMDPEVGLVDAVVTAAADPPSRVVLDEADRLADSPGLELLRRVLAVKGSRVRAVVSSRVDLGLVDDAVRARGAAVELDATHLAFDAEQTAPLLGSVRGDRPALAARVVELTGGWPAVVHRLAEVVGRTPDRVEVLAPGELLGADGALTELVGSLLDEEDDPTRHTLAEVALLASTGPAELARIRGIPTRVAAHRVRDLVHRGLTRPLPGRPSYVATDHVELPPLVRRAVLDDLVAREQDEAGVVAEVVDGLTAMGELPRAIRALADVGATGPVAQLLQDHGDALLTGGHAGVVAVAARSVRGTDRSVDVERCHGDALAIDGELSGALDRFQAALEHGADGPGRLDLVARLGRIHEDRGDLLAAIELFRTTEDLDARGPAAVEVLATWASVHWLRGELDEARGLVGRCAELVDHGGGLAAAARVERMLALVAISDADHAAYERHHRRAFSAADRAGDQPLVARIRVDRAAHHLSEGRTTEALFEIDRALGLDGVPRAAAVRAFARCERAEVLLRTGRLDAAVRDAEAARRSLDGLGSRRVSSALHVLGDIARERGELARASGFYDRCLELAVPNGDQRGRLAATIGTSRVLAATDPAGARQVAHRALGLSAGTGCAGAHLAAGWAALAAGDEDAAAGHAIDAGRTAEHQRDERGRAEAATLVALVEPDPLPGLRDAARHWHRLHDPLWAVRTELAVARRTRRPDERSRTGDLEQRSARLGSPLTGGEVAHRTMVSTGRAEVVRIRLFGELQVRVGQRDVTAVLDGDPPARAVLLALAVASGRSLAREELARVAWPEDPTDPADPRLSVAIAALRSMLRIDVGDPSPISGDGTAVRLRTDVVEIDVVAFERTAGPGLRALDAGREREAAALLRAADELHTGELVTDRSGTGWADRRREELRHRAAAVRRALTVIDTGSYAASR